MNEPLRPLTLGEILDRTAQLYRSRFLMFLGISVIPTGVIVVLACIFGLTFAWWYSAALESTASRAVFVLMPIALLAALLFIALPVYLVSTALSMAAMSHAVSRVHLGQTTTIRDAYKSVWNRGWRYIWLCIIEGLIVGLVPFAVYIVMIFLFIGAAAFARTAGVEDITSGALFILIVVLVVIALIVYIFSMLIRLSMAFPACVVEQIGAWSAITRSWNLSNGTKGRIFVLYLLGMVLSWLLYLGVSLPLTIILSLFISSADPQHAQAAGLVMIFIVYGVSFTVQALVRPVYGIAFVIFYYDQRIRKEGFDIEWMMQQAGLTPPAQQIATATNFQTSQAVEYPQAKEPASPESGESP
jgi:hypothetical protein